MSLHRNVRTVALAALVVAAPALPAGSASAGTVQGGVVAAPATPLRADFTVVASLTPTAAPGVFDVSTAGEGRASHLGRITVSSTEVVDLATSPGSSVVRDGQMVLVAANGDELHWTYAGSGTTPDELGNSAITGTFEITGGTGRFLDATGSGVLDGTVNAQTGVVVVSYRGVVDY